MLKLAVVSAYPIGLNPGMLSSDLALRSFLARHGIAAEVTTFTIGPELTIPGAATGGDDLRYRSLEGWEGLVGFDRVIFWGDFLHSRRFHLTDMPWMTRHTGMSSAPDALDETIYGGLLLEGAPETLLRKVICFGGTIYINSLADAGDTRYIAAISRLFEAARLVLMRDPISAALARQYGASGPALGVDCSLLLQPFGGLNWASDADAPPAISFSFGRGPSRNRTTARLMHHLAEGFARTMKIAEPMALDWLIADAHDPLRDMVDKLAQLRRSVVVVTDTYHCAVNAWREGVPAICVGRGAERATGTLSDKKKELFFAMFGAAEYYVYSEALRRWGGLRATLERLDGIVRHAPTVHRAIRSATEQAEAQLRLALQA